MLDNNYQILTSYQSSIKKDIQDVTNILRVERCTNEVSFLINRFHVDDINSSKIIFPL